MFDVIIVAYGKSQRARLDKLSFDLNGQSVLLRTINAFDGIYGIDNIIVVTDRKVEEKANITVIDGGKTRADSVKCGLELVKSPYVLIHDGARPFVSRNLIENIMQATIRYNSAVPYLKSTDSIRLIKNNRLAEAMDRKSIVSVQTPQGYATSLIKQAYQQSIGSNTDESEIYAQFIEPPFALEGEKSNKKITYFEDLLNINSRIGSGFDTHMFEKGKPLVLGGVNIPFDKGLKAHSDGDVVIHAIMDSLLSAVGERDIGIQFPDSDDSYKNIDSAQLLEKVKIILISKNAIINNITVTIMAQRPRLADYVLKMQERIAFILETDIRRINITVTSTENLGIIGEEKAIAVLAIASVI